MAFKGFKKTHEDDHKVIMTRDDGHEFHISKKALTPKMRGQLAEIPVHQEVSKPAGKEAVAHHKGEMKMADGGKVDRPWNSKEKADFSKGASESGTIDTKPIVDGVKKVGGAIASAIGLADGGEVPASMGRLGVVDEPAPAKEEPGFFSKLMDNLTPGGALQAEQAQNASQMPAPPAGILPPATPANAPEPAPAAPPVAQPGMGGASTSGLGMGQAPANQDPYGMQTQYGATVQGINEQKQGLAGEARALGEQGKAEAAVAQEQAQRVKNLQDSYMEHKNKLDQEGQNFIADIQAAHIDPNRYLGSQSTSQRVMTGIGLILGGMGGALSGGGNPALDMLNKQIDRDIDAQKMDMGKKENLLKFNMAQYGNLRDATDATRAMMNDMTSAQLKQAAAKAQDPLAKGRALQAAGQIDQNTAAIRGQQAMKMTMLNGVKNGTASPEQAVGFLIPAEERPAAQKELKEAQQMVHARDNALSAFDKLAQINTVGGAITSPFQTAKQVAAIRDPIVAQLSKETAGRFTEQDSHMLGALFPAKGDSEETLAAKRAQMNKLVNEKMNFPILKQWNLDPSGWGRFNNGGSTNIKESAPVAPKKK